MNNTKMVKIDAKFVAKFASNEMDRLAFDKFKTYNQLVEFCDWPGKVAYEKFFRLGERKFNAKNIDLMPPQYDHCSCFKNKDAQVYCVYHPYANYNMLREEVEMWCNEYGYSGDVFDESYSWYNPGSTCMVIITSKMNPKIRVDYICLNKKEE